MSHNTKRPGVTDMTEQQDLPAGKFSSWLDCIRSAQGKENGAVGNGTVVPCGECNACCRSSYFIHIKPEETPALAHIPRKLLFPAPFLPKGNVLLGYDQKGHCPMLIDDKCSIYDYRPQTCRNYDCRIFPAAGIEAGDDKALITQQIRRWKFSYPAKRDQNRHSAVQAAAIFLREHAEYFPAGFVPGNATQLAILAIKVYDVFLKYDAPSSKTGRVSPDHKVAKAVMKAYEEFEARLDTPKV